MALGRRVAFVGADARRGTSLATPALRQHAATGRMYLTYVKPLIDRGFALVLLVIVLPLLILVAIGVLLCLGRPLIYRQQRVGHNGRPFTIYKFRSMKPDRRIARGGPPPGVEDRRRTHKTPTDPRLVRFGRFIRKTSLDELPQFVNVLRGDMSLIGPRPELVEIVERYQPWQHHRHRVKPGITGLWQVSSRDRGPMHQNTSIDLCYVDRVTFWMDLWILLRTTVCVVRMNTY